MVILSAMVMICGDFEADSTFEMGLLSTFDRSVSTMSDLMLCLSIANLCSVNGCSSFLMLIGEIVLAISGIFRSLCTPLLKIVAYLLIGLDYFIINFSLPFSKFFLVKTLMFSLDGVTMLIYELAFVSLDSLLRLENSWMLFNC
jgi:hypothetical protein